MNNSRRKKINQCIEGLNDAQTQLTAILNEEQNALAHVPDDEEYDEMRDGMDEIITDLEELMPTLQDAIDTLEGADF
jgi:DNA repair ATPase RecN